MARAARRRVFALAGLTALAGCAKHRPVPLPDPAAARRFEIVAVGDTSFRFLVTGAPWVREGRPGLVVDPRRRDALIARYVVRRRVGDTATAVITGQTSDVSSTHVALLAVPPVGTLHQRSFWIGVVAGGLLGAIAAAVAR